MSKITCEIEQYLYRILMEPKFTLNTISISRPHCVSSPSNPILGGDVSAPKYYEIYNEDWMDVKEYFESLDSKIKY